MLLISIFLCAASGLAALAQNNSAINDLSQSAKQQSMMDIGPFARVISGDPDRRSGCSAGRAQEFRAEDVFIDIDLCRNDQGIYEISSAKTGVACIGLRWLENRSPAQVFIEFTEISDVPSVSHTQVQVWQGNPAGRANGGILREPSNNRANA